ncbi:dipeptide epimerase [Parashewanella spongiae]|uniref:Dipeptide epimerase n=1 Tax=Parashewanella spongiae TaxID=342950 RepID=A0A3A6TG89_9GAMM|nr:N-acetyl-D-Glu racemase DgcA [Parashewanella spongiae]MCL1079494.1 dipeptide epimerase [Parashewanella spongiae]RJY07535.1 dipeptide epimerase [Parashewanella spongiae]
MTKLYSPTIANPKNIFISLVQQSLPLKNIFRIARGAKTQADVIVVTLHSDEFTGWAEAVPYARYQETVESVTAQILSLTDNEQTVTSHNINELLAAFPAGAAKNALDCAWWDLQAKLNKISVCSMLNLSPAQPCITAQTLSIDTPEAMAQTVSKLNNPPLVKVKLDSQNIVEKMIAIRQAAPNSEFIIDANEGWTIKDLTECHEQLHALNVVLIEQPLPAGEDDELLHFNCLIPLCADESCHTRADLNYLQNRYQVVNIKLDKTGGLTEAVLLAHEAKKQGFELMLGCMVGSSLAMAPAALLVNEARFVDLDGPLLIKEDRLNGFEFDQGVMQPLSTTLWGGTTCNNEINNTND